MQQLLDDSRKVNQKLEATNEQLRNDRKQTLLELTKLKAEQINLQAKLKQAQKKNGEYILKVQEQQQELDELEMQFKSIMEREQPEIDKQNYQLLQSFAEQVITQLTMDLEPILMKSLTSQGAAKECSLLLQSEHY